jgi:hypothetical protein
MGTVVQVIIILEEIVSFFYSVLGSMTRFRGPAGFRLQWLPISSTREGPYPLYFHSRGDAGGSHFLFEREAEGAELGTAGVTSATETIAFVTDRYIVSK